MLYCVYHTQIGILAGNVADMLATCRPDTRCHYNFGKMDPCHQHKIHDVGTWLCWLVPTSKFPTLFAPANHCLLLPPLPPPPATACRHLFYGGSGVWWHLMEAVMDDGYVVVWQRWQTMTATTDTTINKQWGWTILRRWCLTTAVGRGNNGGSGVRWQQGLMTMRRW